MNAWVDDALFKPTAARTVDLLALLRSAAEGRHGLVVATQPFGQNAPAFDAWHAALRGPLQREVSELHEGLRADSESVNRAGQPVFITESKSPTPRGALVLNLRRGIRVLSTPFAVTLEHAVHDGQFLMRVLPPDWREVFKRWLDDGLIVFENGGGSALPELVTYFGQAPAKPGSGLTHEEWRRRHFFVVDRDETRDRQGQMARELEAACKRAQIPEQFHVTVRRKQESYLPREAVDADVTLRLAGAELQKMRQDIEAHFKEEDRHWQELPKVGNNPFFKKSFMNDSLDWPESWFDRDAGRAEFESLAARIATLR